MAGPPGPCLCPGVRVNPSRPSTTVLALNGPRGNAQKYPSYGSGNYGSASSFSFDEDLNWLDPAAEGLWAQQVPVVQGDQRAFPPITGSKRYPPTRSMASQDSYDDSEAFDNERWVIPVEDSSQERSVNGKPLLINSEIRAQVVRLLSGEGGKDMLGVKPYKEAIQMAMALGMDLVLLNAEAVPPLCRVVSWSKYKFEVEKENKQKVVRAVTVETKEVRLRPGTDSNDLNTKLKSASKFLQKGHKVKLVMKFEGRELQFKEQGKLLMLKFLEDLSAVGKVDGAMNFKAATYTVLVGSTGKQQQAQAAAEAAKVSMPNGGGALGLPPPSPEAAGLPLPMGSMAMPPAGLPMPASYSTAPAQGYSWPAPGSAVTGGNGQQTAPSPAQQATGSQASPMQRPVAGGASPAVTPSGPSRLPPLPQQTPSPQEAPPQQPHSQPPAQPNNRPLLNRPGMASSPPLRQPGITPASQPGPPPLAARPSAARPALARPGGAPPPALNPNPPGPARHPPMPQPVGKR